MKRWLFVGIGLAALFALIFWRLQSKRAEQAAAVEMRQRMKSAPVVVGLAPATARDIVHTFEGVGTVEAPFNVKLASKVTGRIDYLTVREGDAVKQGQVLARIDPSEIQAQVQQAQANLAQAQSRLAQAQLTQNPTNVSISTQIRQQVAGLTSTQADYDQTRQNYNAQVASAESAVTDAQGRVLSASAAIGNAQAAIRSAQANLDNARTHFNRVNNLYGQGFVAAQDVDDAKTQVSVQAGALDVARGQLNSAQATKQSAEAQVASAQHQLDIVKTKGKADIEAARARVTQAKAALDYARSNTAQVPAYRANLAALRSSVVAAQAAVDNAKAQLANTVLTAPMDGFVTQRTMDPGAMATPGVTILSVQTIHQVWVTVPIPEEVNRKVHLGQTADVSFDALPGTTFQGKITQINPSADPTSRQFAARVTLDNARNVLKPGMFGRVTLVTDLYRQATVVPREAVSNGKAGATVTVVDADNKAHIRPVTTGPSDAEGVAIDQGLQPGEQVVVMTSRPVKDGDTVRQGGRPGGPGAGRKR